MNTQVLRDKVRYFGVRGAAQYYGYRAINRLTYFDALYALRLTMDDLDPGYLSLTERFRGEFLDAETLRRLARDPAYDMDPQELEAALRNGDQCFAIMDGDTLASYSWYSQAPTPLSGQVALHFDSAYVYMYRAFTRPEYRGQRLHALGKAQALQHFSAAGAKGLLSVIRVNNLGSLRSAQRMGGKIIGKLFACKMLNRYFFVADEGCEQYCMRLEISPPGSSPDLP